MRRLIFISTIMTVLLGLSTPAISETLDMPQQEADTPTYSIDLPGRGMAMTEVEERFGQPRDKVDEVGDPPISRWIYDDFIVYFEYQFVLHAVVTRPSP